MDITESNEVAGMTPECDKAVRLFTYLKELCALRTTQVRNVATYDQVFWLRDLPRHKLCRCTIWRLTDPSSPTSEQHADSWIEIRKPALKSPPELPDELEPWVKDEELTDSSLSEPGLYEQILLSALQVDSDTDPHALASINDYPHIFDKWVDYVETKWKPWAEEDRVLQKVQKAYNQLFNIYQRQEKLGEQYEVIFGAGLLLWKSPNSGEINRHILTIPTRIEFDRHRGALYVGPIFDVEYSKPALEYTMLETHDRPNPTQLNDIEKEVVKVLVDNPWDAVNIDSVLCGFSNALPVPGDYSPSFEHAGVPLEKPVIRLAPALILRKRTRQTFEAFYNQIMDQIKKGEEIPENVRKIIDIVDDSASGGKEIGETEAGTTTPTLSDVELYFPLPANDDQKRIVQKVVHRRGVLVQGPPGTGKSHTIANLISHFLAKGKRILVTSETPRALEILRSKLPCEIDKLCVVWLGSGPNSQEALRKSVGGITQKKANWNASKERNLIDQYVRQLDAERKEQAKLRHDLRACREADIYQHSIVFGHYSGTLQQIAMEINQDSDQFQWFIDRPSNTTDPVVTADELLKMTRIHKKLTPEIVEQLKYHLFPLEQLIQPNEFCRLVDAERRADLAHKEAQDKRSYPGYAQLSALDREKRDAVKRMIEVILSTPKHFHSWAERVSCEILGGQDRVWREILASSIDHIDRIEYLLNKYVTLDVTGLDAKDLRLVENHATDLKKHFELGKGLGFGFFRARAVKDGLYLIKSVTVNGKPCNNLQTLNQLTAWIEISTGINNLGDLWKMITTPPAGSVVLQCAAYRDLCKPIEQALALHARIEEVRRTCRDCPGICFPAWHSQEEVRTFSKALDALNLEEDFATTRRVFVPLVESLTDFINSGHSHTSTGRLLQAVNERDVGLYRGTYETLSSLHTWANEHNYACDVHKRFHACAPRTCKSYDDPNSELIWDERLKRFEAAWAWAKIDRWLDEVSDKGRPKRIQRALENSALRERNTLKNLAASKAWFHCMERLSSAEQSALKAWAAEVAEIKSGKGKYAEKHRENARQYMDQCKSAIPVWVMPLYQVVQTIRPALNVFDVVIIDEASQSGAEAWLLNYIGEKIIVIGDPQQISPMNIGLNLEFVEYLRRKYLKDIPFAATLGPPHSLFDQVKVRYHDEIHLREHFRCMPEIIQFSNNLAYPNTPLIPLRQYGADRLEPVRTVFVKDGYRKGASDDIENPPEAEAIVAQIAECCEDPAYDGKTFGVISLMGSRQAELINSLLLEKNGIGAQEMEKRRLVCGRPYDFQGDECDVIFLSMVDAPQDGQPCRMMRDADTQRRFNVASSRAKDQLWLFHSATLNDLRPECLRYRLLEYCLNPKVGQPEEIGETTFTALRRMAIDKSLRERRPRDADNSLPFDSWFEVDVFLKIVDRGYRVLPQYELAGYRIDLVIQGLKGQLAVECDGDEWHGPDRYEADMARQRDLERCQQIFWRVRGSDFYRDPDGALTELWETLASLKITPRHSWESDRKQSEKESAMEDSMPASEVTEENRENLDDDVEENEEKDEVELKKKSSDNTLFKQRRLFEEDQDEDRKDESLAAGFAEGRLDSALKFARSRRREERSPLDIQNAIVNSLKKCSNHSCTLKSLTSRVLKELGVRTRGNPRLEFEKRVMRNLSVLKSKGQVEEYKSKNRRIRLLA